MKTIIYSLVAVLLIASCSKDENNDFDSLLIGTWELTELRVETPLDINGDGVKNTNLLQETSCIDSQSKLIFSSETEASLFYNSSMGFSIIEELEGDNNYLFGIICSINATLEPKQYSYTNIENSVVLTADEDKSLTLNGDVLFLLEPNGFVANDEETSEVVIEQDIIQVFKKI